MMAFTVILETLSTRCGLFDIFGLKVIVCVSCLVPFDTFKASCLHSCLGLLVSCMVMMREIRVKDDPWYA